MLMMMMMMLLLLLLFLLLFIDSASWLFTPPFWYGDGICMYIQVQTTGLNTGSVHMIRICSWIFLSSIELLYHSIIHTRTFIPMILSSTGVDFTGLATSAYEA